MEDIAGLSPCHFLRQAIVQVAFVIYFVRLSEAQVYSPVFKSLEMQATIAPLGQMVVGNFSGHTSIAALSKTEKAIYFFEPDSLENLILTDVVTLPDTPVAITKGTEIVFDTSEINNRPQRLAVLMKPHYLVQVSFTKDGQPVVSDEVSVDAYSTGIRAADLETTGKLDMVTFGRFTLGISVAKNIGGGKFQVARMTQSPVGGFPFSDVAFTDFNGDMVPDMAALDWVNHKLLISYGRGDGTFAQPVSFQLRSEPATLLVADLNGNGYPDILVGYARNNQIDFFAGDGVGRFFPRQTMKAAGPVTSYAVADFTGDGTTDIAAFSKDAGEITMFSYDPMTRVFRYAGVIGIGNEYREIVPFYFPNRFRADIVASSPKEKFIKVFKANFVYNKSPAVMVPTSGNPVFLSVSGTDSSNCLIVGDSSGRITATNYEGNSIVAAKSAIDWQSQGIPNSCRLVSSAPPSVLLSYANADLVGAYEIPPDGNGIVEHTVQTAYLPFVTNGLVADDSAIIAAAYRDRPDSSVEVSFFNSIKGKAEFIEQDYAVNEKQNYVASALTVGRSHFFFGVWASGEDTVTLSCTDLERNKKITRMLTGSRCEFVEDSSATLPLLLLEYHDTLSVSKISIMKPDSLELHEMVRFPYGNVDFNSTSVAAMDSTYFLAYYDRSAGVVFLYSTNSGPIHLIKSWHVESEPEEIAISPEMGRIYFLDKSESYVSIHTF